MWLRKAFTAAEWEDSNDHDGYYDSNANTNASSEKRKETKERTYATNSESCEATEQEQGRNDCFSIEEGFYDTQAEAQGAVEWQTDGLGEGKIESVTASKKFQANHLSKTVEGEKSPVDSTIVVADAKSKMTPIKMIRSTTI